MSDDSTLKLRHDPLPYLRSLATVEGIALRRMALRDVVPGDWDLGDQLMRRTISQQDAEGSWDDDLESTGRRMLELLDLDVVANHPALELAAEWALDHLAPVYDQRMLFTLDQAPALLALVRLGRNFEGPVLRVVSPLSFDVDRWLPAARVEEIVWAIRLLLADPQERRSAAVPRATAQLMQIADTPEATDQARYHAFDVCGLLETEDARNWVERHLAFVADRQEEVGAWGPHTTPVVRALCAHGLWEALLP